MRLQHGLRADSPWIDPESKEFDPQVVIQSFQDWQYQPFVKFILYLKEQPLDNPYYHERLAMLKTWADTGAYRVILDRREDVGADQLIEVVEIRAYELAPEGQAVDPYVIVSNGDRKVLQTRSTSGVRTAQWKDFKSTDRDVDQPRALRDGQPLFLEIWDDNYLDDTFLGGFAIYPASQDAVSGAGGERVAEYTTRILWEWREPQTISRPGHARVWVRFLRRQANAGQGAAKEAK